MGNKIIWKVLLMVSGVFGSIISVINLPKEFDNFYYWKEVLEHSVSDTEHVRAKISDAKACLWGIILFVSIIIFIVGCEIKTKSNKPK